ncbi:hypothetical protein [Halochromatium glycolicum]|uniref:Uncharacterized protein n=1 Tax=Halochromatium glycolicum TaxID=85075 RepID=A0AAJ0XA41_9GAMM|nr:hypothetical protein [Halochromatium glycolicum]MBK1704407.1 hypothetical protein [Halochromatium glycolicum]
MGFKRIENTNDWAEALRLSVANADETGIASVFSSLAWRDGEQIARRAHRFLEEIAPYYLAEQGPSAATAADRLRIDLFRESMLAYFEDKPAPIDTASEDDATSWVIANAPAAASANLQTMEAAMGTPGVRTHRAIIKLHKHLDMRTCEALQQRVLMQVWEGIQATLAELLAAAPR